MLHAWFLGSSLVPVLLLYEILAFAFALVSDLLFLNLHSQPHTRSQVDGTIGGLERVRC